MGANVGQTALPFLKGGMTGLSQGLQQQQNPNAQLNFSNFQQGLQAFRKKPPLGNPSQIVNPQPQTPNNMRSNLYG